jgi:hypothetical protein
MGKKPFKLSAIAIAYIVLNMKIDTDIFNEHLKNASGVSRTKRHLELAFAAFWLNLNAFDVFVEFISINRCQIYLWRDPKARL